MTKSLRIRTTPNGGDQYIKIKLEQSFDFLEILSLKLTQAEIYRKFASDYGVIVGRVIANRGFGVPNAKVSIFIPLDDDETNSEIIGRYPYTSVVDQDVDGIRYNLLEDTKQYNCHKAVGTFPNKRKVLDNDVWLEIYDKYYKFTTTTNNAGDFMIFGVPTGNQKIHMDVDVSNIGFLSLKPFDLVSQGYTENLFESNTTFKGSTDLDSLVQLQKRDFNVNVLPFWGDSNEQEIGINRVDFNLGVDITPSALFFGSIYTNQEDSGFHKGCAPRAFMGDACSLKTGRGTVEAIRRISRTSNEVEVSGGGNIDSDGNWAYNIPMNLDRVVTDEFGNLIPSEDPTVGIPTKASIRFRIALDEYKFGFRKRTAHYLVPNMYNRFMFNNTTDDGDFYEMRWKKVYTVTNYIPRYQKFDILFDATPFHSGIKDIQNCEVRPMPFNRMNFNANPIFSIICVIVSIIGVIFDIINDILEKIIFDVVMGVVCFFKHIFDGGQQGACRCRACYDLNGATGCDASYWGGCVDCCECATCYSPDDSGVNYALDDVTPAIFTGGDIISNVTCPFVVDGTYFGIPQGTTNGSGNGAIFSVEFSGGTVTVVTVTNGGQDYQDMSLNPFIGAGEQVSLDFSSIPALAMCSGSTVIVQTTVASHYSTFINGIDCSTFNSDDCNGECSAGACQIAFLPIECNGVDYFSGEDWAACTVENLAEDLDVIQYDFYNDWIIGSLYSPLLDYKVISGIGGKNLETFCDFNCRDIATPPNPSDPHRDNICQEASIYEKHWFVNESTFFDIISPLEIPPFALPPTGQVSNLFYSGLVREENNYLYYASRHDIGANTVGAPDLVVDAADTINQGDGKDKHQLLFASNIIELGSTVKCDLDGEPFVIDRFTSTSYQKDNGTGTLFSILGCGVSVTDMNYNGWRLMSQAGIEIVVAEAASSGGSLFQGDDGETYNLVGSQINLPDEGRNSGGILLFDRDDRILRKHLCENFPYYSTTGVYSSTPYPSGSDYIESLSVSGFTTVYQAISGFTDICAGFDDQNKPFKKMPPYYTYFGVGKTSSLDLLKSKFFNPCIN